MRQYIGIQCEIKWQLADDDNGKQLNTHISAPKLPVSRPRIRTKSKYANLIKNKQKQKRDNMNANRARMRRDPIFMYLSFIQHVIYSNCR